MDPPSSCPVTLAPGAASHAVSAPTHGRRPSLPAIDDNVLGEGCRHEVVDGEVYELSPANEDHGAEHFLLPVVLGTALKPEYKGCSFASIRLIGSVSLHPPLADSRVCPSSAAGCGRGRVSPLARTDPPPPRTSRTISWEPMSPSGAFVDSMPPFLF